MSDPRRIRSSDRLEQAAPIWAALGAILLAGGLGWHAGSSGARAPHALPAGATAEACLGCHGPTPGALAGAAPGRGPDQRGPLGRGLDESPHAIPGHSGEELSAFLRNHRRGRVGDEPPGPAPVGRGDHPWAGRVECATCHDGLDASPGRLIRATGSLSRLCTACHLR